MTEELLQCLQPAGGSAETNDGKGSAGLAPGFQTRITLGLANRNSPMLLLTDTRSFIFHGFDDVSKLLT
jgi:hypothetical protein